MDDLRTSLIEKSGPEVLVHGVNPAVRRSLTELRVIHHPGEENTTEDFDRVWNKELDDIGEQHLRRTPNPRDA